jgi:2-polyprenyl-3-methyl-5-hydroxy-6-metoxy-1,4-benzoquinol methylase
MITENIKCLACNGSNLTNVLDLGDQPLANSYLNTLTASEDVFPLTLNFCTDCTHLQLGHSIHPDALFKHYVYVSGTSNAGVEYFKNFVGITQEYVENAKTVLDIACNDGTQLNFYHDAGLQTYGIDPAKNLFPISSKKNKIICDYLTAENIKNFGVEFDIIIAQNVFAHNNYPKEFLEYCKSVISDRGCIFIQTSQANMIDNNEFDTIYHEHLSFFSVKSFCAVAKQAGLNVIDIRRTSIHGTSFLFVLSKTGEDRSNFFQSYEVELTLNKLKSYADTTRKIIVDLKNTINEYKEKGYRIVGYGAAAKGNTLLNFGKIKLDYIVDDNPLKIGLYTPGMKIPIRSPDTLLEEKEKLVIVPLAWNFYDEIKQKVQQRTSATFIRYFPSIIIE